MSGVHLTDGSQNPFVNNGVINGDTYGILADYVSGVTWRITNQLGAQITSQDDHGVGVSMPNGLLINGGYIEAFGTYGTGVYIHAGTIDNGGLIGGGAAGAGAWLATGTVNNTGDIGGGLYGVTFSGVGSVSNLGTISSGLFPTGTTAAYGIGVDLEAGGRVVNGLVGTATTNRDCYIDAPTGVYVNARTGTSTVVNYGTIAPSAALLGFYTSVGVEIDGTAQIFNGSIHNDYARIAGFDLPAIEVTNGLAGVYNYGVIKSYKGLAVSLAYGGVFDNLPTLAGSAGAVYGGKGGVYVGGSNAFVNNDGVIAGGTDFGVKLDSGRVVNHGLIKGGTYGVLVIGAGTLTNYGVIDGPRAGASIAFAGVQLDSFGTLINDGTIAGPTGVKITGGTLVNAGKITGSSGYAVSFYGYDNRLVLEATSRIVGRALAVLSPLNVLELASTAGHRAGALTGLGSSIAGFQTVMLDAGAHWTLSGANTSDSTTFDLAGTSALTLDGRLDNVGGLTLGNVDIGAGGELHVAGALTTQSLTLSGQAALSVASTGTVVIGGGATSKLGEVYIAKTGTLGGDGRILGSVVDRGLVETDAFALTVTGNLTGDGAVTIAAGGALSIDGALATATAFAAGGGETLKLAAPAKCQAVLSGFAKTDSIDLLNEAATGASFAGGVLTVSGAGGATLATLKFAGAYVPGNFALVSDHHGGTDIVYRTAPSPAPLLADAFVQAMAGLGGQSAAAPPPMAERAPGPGAMLTAPRFAPH